MGPAKKKRDETIGKQIRYYYLIINIYSECFKITSPLTLTIGIIIMAGRRRIELDNQIITTLRERGISWMDIARHPQVNVCRETLRLWRIDTNFVEPKVHPSVAELDTLVQNFIEGEPRRGFSIIESFLSLSGYHVTQAELRACMHRVDPEGVASRSQRTIQRRVYSVIGPHHLWHHDGNHKLIR